MEEEKYWTRFIQCGRVEDYLRFTAARQKREMNEGGCRAVYNRSTGYQGSDCKREGPLGYSADT